MLKVSRFDFRTGSRSSNKDILPEEGQVMIVKAESFVLDLLQSIQTGRVTVATLKVLRPHADQLLRLAEIFQENEGNNVNGSDRRSSEQPSCQPSYYHRLDELKRFNLPKKQLPYFVSSCESFLSGKYPIPQYYHSCSI